MDGQLAASLEAVGAVAALADPLLAQSAVDRLASGAHTLVVEGESYRRRQRPGRITPPDPAPAG